MRPVAPLSMLNCLVLVALHGCGGYTCYPFCPRPRTERPAHFDLLIRNARVVDGTGNPWYRADVGVRGDRIAAVGRFAAATAAREIDAAGRVLAPGFIDMLGQSEFAVLIDPRAVSKVSQGITTEVTGEGSSVAPMTPDLVERMRPYLDHYKLTVDWTDLEGYFRRLDRQGAGVNLATFAGATQVRKVVLGFSDRSPTADELRQMQELVRRAMEQGALGVSSSLQYAPARYATTDELIALARAAAEHGGIYATHIRSEGNAIDAALDEAFRIAEAAQVRVEIWHLKVSGRPNWGRMPHVLQRIESARARGLDIAANVYPYTAAATGLDATIPPWAHSGGTDSLVARLRDPDTRARLKQEIAAPASEWENIYDGAGGAQGVLLTSALNPELDRYEGKTVAEIARLMGYHDPLDAIFDLLIADRAQTDAVYFVMDEEDVRRAIVAPWVSFDTDYGAVAPDGPLSESPVHPRSYGSFPRILGKYVRDEQLLPLEEAIRKMTSLPAQRVGLHDRGILRPGMAADLVIFDPQRVRDLATFQSPHQVSVGIETTIVNGVVVWENGRHTGALPGRPLRGPGARAHTGEAR